MWAVSRPLLKSTHLIRFSPILLRFLFCRHSAHQAYSHRVKSLAMSHWTLEEVEALRKRNGGGNEVARAKWFALWTSEDEAKYAPKENDSLDKHKELVVMETIIISLNNIWVN